MAVIITVGHNGTGIIEECSPTEDRDLDYLLQCPNVRANGWNPAIHLKVCMCFAGRYALLSKNDRK